MSDLDADRTVRMEGRGEVDPERFAWEQARKRPVTVQATPMPAPFEVETPEGTVQGDAGDVLIRGVKGELYPCDAEVFADTYDIAHTWSDDDVPKHGVPDEWLFGDIDASIWTAIGAVFLGMAVVFITPISHNVMTRLIALSWIVGALVVVYRGMSDE